MASETQLRPPPFSSATMWPPDDTEESILGTDLHQMTISNLRLGINELARSAVRATNRCPGRRSARSPCWAASIPMAPITRPTRISLCIRIPSARTAARWRW